MSPSPQNSSGPPAVRRLALSLPTLISLSLAALFLSFLVFRFEVDPKAIWVEVGSSHWWYLALAFPLHYTTFLFRGARWRLLLRNVQGDGQPAPGALYCAQLVFLGWFANSVAWLRLGDAYRAYLYRDERSASFSRTIGTILAERVLDTILVTLLLLAAVPFLIQGSDSAAWPVLAVSVALACVLLLVIAGIGLVGGAAARMMPGWLAERYERLREGTRGVSSDVFPVSVWGLLGWLAEIGRLYLVSQALGLDASVPLVVFIALANSLLTLAPTPGGVGAVESGVPALLVQLSSIPVSSAAALVLVDRTISYVSVVVLGGALLLMRHIFGRSLRGQGREIRSGKVEKV
jgi:uncharacterized protein (TIRG00374 family)